MNRWDTKFGAWVTAYGTARLVRDLDLLGVSVSARTIYHWVSGTIPRKRVIDALISLSGGTLNVQSIYEHAGLVTTETPGRLPRTCKAGAR